MQAPADRSIAIARVRLARVMRHERWFTAHYLHPAEREIAAALSIDKRRIDFIAGRVAAKRALPSKTPTSVEIVAEEGPRAGAPLARQGGRSLGTGVSISHGAGWSCAATATGRIGIDIERIEARHPAFTDEAFTRDELSMWQDALEARETTPAVVTTAWCAKEAMLKWLGHGLRANLLDQEIRGVSWTSPQRRDSAQVFELQRFRWGRIWSQQAPSCLFGLWADSLLVIAIVADCPDGNTDGKTRLERPH